MRLFQNSGVYPAYLQRLNRLSATALSFAERRNVFLADRFGACHFLKPVLDREKTAFFTNGDDEALQRMWAKEHGLNAQSTLQDILLAQIEDHRTEVFYNLDPLRFGSDFVRRLPGCVRKSICWRAAPSPGADFGEYDFVVCNFPSILRSYSDRGWKAAYFAPAHDSQMDGFAASEDRPVDVVFIGGYSRHHRRRAQMLEAVADLRRSHSVVMHLDRSRLTRWSESPLGRLLPLGAHRRPAAIQDVSHDPVFGLGLYETLSRARIVINGAIDMAGNDRGNMRCFEAMGCGCALLTDEGNYPEGMTPGETMATYSTPDDAVAKLELLLADTERSKGLATRGYRMVSGQYSKDRQWNRFVELVM